jgi:hypothetical protein
MAGKLIQILPKRAYDFSTMRLGTSQRIVLAEHIDISEYIDCIVAARINSITAGGSNTISLDIYGDGYTDDDPSLSFLTAAPLFSSVLLTTAPFLVTYGGTIRGHYASAIMTATRGQMGALKITMSADLVLRCPDDTVYS